MEIRRIILVFCYLFFFNFSAFSQVTQGDFEGTDFWVAFMKNNDATGNTRTLTFTARSAATVTVKTPKITGAGTLNQTLSVPANGIVSLNIADSYAGKYIENNPANTIKSVGIHITATSPVTVYGYSIYGNINPDSWINIPTPNLGTSYLVIGLDAWGANASRATVIATEDNTNITFTVPANVTLSSPAAAAGTSFSRILNQGDVYTLEGESSGLDLSITGVKITANKKIGVYNGSGNLVGPCNYWANNYGAEMALPISTWGKEYVVKEFNSVSNACPGGPVTSYARIISSSSVPITISITTTAGLTLTQTLNYEGAFYDWGITGPAIISAPLNQIAVVEMFTVNTTFTNILPVQQWGVDNISTTNPAAFTGASDNKAIIVQKSNGTGKVWLDGVLQTGFTQIGTSNYYYKDVVFAPGLRTFSGDSSYIVYPYGDQGPAGVKTYCNPASGGKLSILAVPVELLSFNVHKLLDRIKVEWTTASEKNSLRFEIERSSNGIDFRQIGFVNASGNNIDPKEYDYFDELPSTNNPIPGILYYRLKQVDIDGKYTYSPLVSVHLKSVNAIKINPLPVKSISNIDLTCEQAGFAELTIFSTDGKKILFSKTGLQAGFNNVPLDMSSISAGIYFLSINTNDHTQYFRIVKQ